VRKFEELEQKRDPATKPERKRETQ